MDGGIKRRMDIPMDLFADGHTDADRWMDRQNFPSIFYRTLSPIGSAVQKDTSLANFS